MQQKESKPSIYNLPNLVSLIRILMVPVLFSLAFSQQATWFLVVLIFSEFTDVLDGFLARYLNQITSMGSHLDSWGDFSIYSSISICAWILWPEIVQQNLPFLIIIIASFTLPVLLGLIKFRTFTSYHTWSVKIAVAITVISYLLLFSGLLDWPIKVAAFVSLIAALEEMAITLIIKHEHADVRSLIQALQYRRQNNSNQ